MTAIDKFIRLEAVGWWFEAGRQEAREVIVSFGDDTLQISSLKDVPLTHWSLLATRRVGTRGEAIIYSADPEQHEVLEIEEPEMIRAIGAITSMLTGPAPVPKWRRWVRWLVAGAALVALLWAAPPAIYKAATMLTPPQRVAALSEAMKASLRARYGAECKGWLGQRALADYAAKLLPDARLDLMVFSAQTEPAIALPTGVALSDATLQSSTPESLAALVLAYWAAGQNQKPLAAYVESLGPLGALSSLVFGRFPTSASPPQTRPDGADYVRARDQLQSQGFRAIPLQQIARTNGIGLPLGPVNAANGPFNFENFATLQNICQE